MPLLDIFLRSSSSALIPLLIIPPLAATAGGLSTISLNIFSALDIQSAQIEYVNDALEKLEKQSPFHAKIIENKYFLGMKNKEIAKHLNVSLSKVEKDVHFAIAWLKREMSK